MINWVENYEEDTIDPQDGEEPISIDFLYHKKRDFIDDIKQAYERGFRLGQKSVVNIDNKKE